MEMIFVLILIFFTTLVATFLSSLSGGGSGIIITPVFLFMGLSYPLTIAIQAVSAIFWVLPAANNYLGSKKIEWKFLLIYSLIGLTGAIAGVFTIISITERVIKTIIGAVIILLVIYVIIDKKMGLKSIVVKSKSLRIIGYFTAIPLGFYETFFGAGNGLIFSVINYKTRGFDMKESLGNYYVISFVWCLIGTILLFVNGFFNVPYMITATIGSIIGGYYGSKLGNYKGNAFIKGMFVIVGLILGFKLLFNL